MATSLWPILLPILTTGLTQVVKVLFLLTSGQRPALKDLFKWGGFPSSHSALVACLATVVAILSGVYSAEFAIALAFAVIVVRDAMGLRMFVQAHARAINQLRALLPQAARRRVAEQEASVGHTRIEVAGGIAVGVIVAFGWYLVFGF